MDMHFITSAKFSLPAFLLAVSLLVGQETQSMHPEKEMGMSTSMRERKMVGCYNSSCRINLGNPCNVFVSGSFIYWQPIQENMELGVVSNTTDDLDLVNGDDVDLHFRYKPGFKVGLGLNFDYDHWDTFVEYTWFRATEHVEKNLDCNNPDIALLPAWQIPNFLNPQYTSGSEKWRLRMDLVNWDLARSYFVGKHLCFRPFIGLRGAFIRQNVDVDYTNVTPSDLLIWPSTCVNESSRSWGIGPRMGLSSNWNFCNGFRLYGNGDVDVLFTQYDLRSKQSSAVTTANRYIVRKDDANYLRTHLDLGLGLGWGTYLDCKKYHLDLSADYSFQVFFDQNMFRNTVSAQAVGKGILPNGNLYLQGLTVTARFDF